MLLIAVTAAVFGPLAGTVYALCGALASASVTYALGRRLGRETVRRLAGHRLNALSQRLARRGVLAIVVVRLLPVAPYSVVNLVAGASHIGWRDFLLGTALGLLPGIVMASLFVDRAIAAIRDPGPVTYVVLCAVAAAIVGVGVAARRWLRAPAPGQRPDHGRGAADAP
jgi:phospholipase D1/2